MSKTPRSSTPPSRRKKAEKRRSQCKSTQLPAQTSLPTEIIDNFLYLGGERALNPSLLQQLGIRYIVNTAKSIAPELAQVKDQSGNDAFVYLHLKMRDAPDENIFKFLQPGVAFIQRAKTAWLSSPENNKVLVHCKLGVSRSVTIVLGYLIADGFEFEQAVNYVRARRTEADPNQGFLSQLAYWQLTLKGTVPNDASLADVVEMIEQDIRAAEIAAHNSRDKWKNLFTSQNLSRVPPELANSMIQDIANGTKKNIVEFRRIASTLQKLIASAENSPSIREWAEVSLTQINKNIELSVGMYNSAIQRAKPKKKK